MEMLNYSLWFTLVWWAYISYKNDLCSSAFPSDRHFLKELMNSEQFCLRKYGAFLTPAIAILLEYLIVR